MIKTLIFLTALLFGSYFQVMSQDSQVTVQVNDSDGKPIIAAAVTLIQNGHVVTSGYTGLNGEVRLGGFDSGEYTLKASYLKNEAEVKIKIREGVNRSTLVIKRKEGVRLVCFRPLPELSILSSPYGSGDRLTHIRCRPI